MHASLSDAIEDFLRFRKSQDVAKNTIARDQTTLRKFLLVNGNIWVHTVSERHVTHFFEEIGKTKQSQSMRNDYSSLNLFFDWARQTKRMSLDNNPMYGRKPPRAVTKERNRVHVSKFPALLDAAGQRSPRDRAAIALLLFTLARDGEITDLRHSDLDLEGGYLKVRVHKTRTEDRVPICAELDTELRRWLTHYTEEVGFLEPHYYLVPRRKTTPLRDPGSRAFHGAVHQSYVPDRRLGELGRLVGPALGDIGFPVVDEHGKRAYEGAHTIRRSGARALYDRLAEGGYDRAIRIVQSMLHHSSVVMTEKYLGITHDRRTRDDILRGQVMYPSLLEVAQLRAVE